ncbi:MAG: phosphatidylserine/phosphatidylglycerophosphate/cardiolipin synthase family protein [Oligoflexia bacterium]|nr:phosphatidylserine/phosphatidylglycerophosphate/cardiolipin synthase family protein [Oligoflexia bacterium]
MDKFILKKLLTIIFLILTFSLTVSSIAQDVDDDYDYDNLDDAYSDVYQDVKDIKKLNFKINFYQKLLDHGKNFKKTKLKWINGRLQFVKYRVKTNIVAENCILGVSSKITQLAKYEDDDDIVVFNNAAPIDLTKEISLAKVNYFSTLQVGQEIVLNDKVTFIFKGLIKRSFHSTNILKLNNLCQERKELIDELKKIKEIVIKKNLAKKNDDIVTTIENTLEDIVIYERTESIKRNKRAAQQSDDDEDDEDDDEDDDDEDDDEQENAAATNVVDETQSVPNTSSAEYALDENNRPGDRKIHGSRNGQQVMVSLLDGQESLAYRFNTMDNAKKSIYVQTLHFMGDEAGIAVAEKLIKKKQEGLDVKVYIDNFTPFLDIRDENGKLKPTKAIGRTNAFTLYDNLLAAGIPVYGYRCGGKAQQLKAEIKLALKKRSLRSFMKRIHDKIMVIDGDQTAVMGGMNIHNFYFQVEPDGANNWRDQDIAIVGNEAVQDVNDIFEENIDRFAQVFGKPENQDCFNKHKPGTKAYMKFYNEMKTEYVERIVERPELVKVVEDLKKGIIKGQKYEPKFLSLEEGLVIQNRPKLEERKIEEEYVNLFNKAKKEIIIVNAFFVPSRTIKNAMLEAARRGVKIKLLTNGRKTNDPPFMAHLGRYFYKDVVDENFGTPREIEIYEWDGTDKKTGEQVRGMLHAKFFIIDGVLSFVGSFNFDVLSYKYNSEIGISMVSQEVAKSLREKFYSDDLKYANRVSYEEILDWRRVRSYKGIMEKLLFKVGMLYNKL